MAWVGLWAAQALAEAPGYAELVGQAVAARKAGDLPTAAAALERALELNYSPELANNLARVNEEMGKYAIAYDIYVQVSNDPLADRSLRALDSGRMAALQPKIGVAWVVPEILPVGSAITVDGRLLAGRALRLEQATGPGWSSLELIAPGAEEVVVRVLKFPVGERTTFTEDLTKRPEADAIVSFANILPVGEVRLNGRRLATDLAVIPTCRVSSGPLVLDIRRPGIKPEVHELDLDPGAQVAVSEILRSEHAPMAGAISQPWRPSRAPWYVGGAGGAATLAGVGFLLSASAAKGELDDHTEGKVALSHPEAQDLNERADGHGTLGNALLGVGVAALVGGTIWYVDQMDAPAEEYAAPGRTPEPSQPPASAPDGAPKPAAETATDLRPGASR